MHRVREDLRRMPEGDTPRVWYGGANKEVARKGICIVMKTKGRPESVVSENTSGWGRREGPEGDTFSRTLAGDYRIRYYLSSEKLKAYN
jgi:hypothetical protein